MADLEVRVGEIEDDVSILKQDVAKIGTQVQGIGDSQGIVIESLQEIRKDVNKSQQTNWGTIAAVGILFLTIFGGGISYVISEVNSDNRRTDAKADKAIEMLIEEKDARHKLELDMYKRELDRKNKP